MAPVARSNQMQECIIERYGETADFDGKSLRAWPTAKVIAGASAEELSRQCKWGYRAKFLVKTAQAVQAQQKSFAGFQHFQVVFYCHANRGSAG